MSGNDSSKRPPPQQGGEPQQGGPAGLSSDQPPQYGGSLPGSHLQPLPGAPGYFPQHQGSEHQDPSQQPRFSGGLPPGAQGQSYPLPAPTGYYGQQRPGNDKGAMTQYGGPPQPYPFGSSAEYHHGGLGSSNAPYRSQHGPPSGPGASADGNGGHDGQRGSDGKKGMESVLVAGATGAMVGQALGFGKLCGMIGGVLVQKAMKKKH